MHRIVCAVSHYEASLRKLQIELLTVPLQHVESELTFIGQVGCGKGFGSRSAVSNRSPINWDLLPHKGQSTNETVSLDPYTGLQC